MLTVIHDKIEAQRVNGMDAMDVASNDSHACVHLSHIPR